MCVCVRARARACVFFYPEASTVKQMRSTLLGYYAACIYHYTLHNIPEEHRSQGIAFFLVVYSAIIVNDHNAEALPVLLTYAVYTNPGFKSVSLSICWKVGKVHAQRMVRNVNVF